MFLEESDFVVDSHSGNQRYDNSRRYRSVDTPPIGNDTYPGTAKTVGLMNTRHKCHTYRKTANIRFVIMASKQTDIPRNDLYCQEYAIRL